MNNAVTDIYDALYARYGDLRWWPARTPYEVITGAVLTQNTAWGNVEKAISNFNGRLSPGFVLEEPDAGLIEIIKPAGFYRQKAACLKALTKWFGGYGFDVQAVRGAPPGGIRAELLAIKGVGRETADSIMLYAFGFCTFVVDAYTTRLCRRYPVDAGKDYEAVKSFFERRLPRDAGIYNRYHALIVVNGKTHCRKKPACGGCPLAAACGRNGV